MSTTAGNVDGGADAAPPAVLTSVVDHTLVITLNRPRVKNAINSELSMGVTAALAMLDRDDGLRVGVLTGADGVFCAGMDLREFARSGLPEGIDTLLRNGCRKPLIASIEGFALGGGLELALIADLLVAASDARLGSPEVKFGLFPGGGALLRLPRLLPRSIVTEMAFTGEPMTARAALDHGLIVRMPGPGEALGAALELATAVANNAPLGVDAVKQLLAATPGMSEGELWSEQVRLVETVFNSEDASEGAQAFAEKRSPAWQGR